MTDESITISPRLLSPGEPVIIRLTSTMEYVPLTLEMTPQYLEEEFSVGEGIRVTWDETGPVKNGLAMFTPEKPGNYLIRFGEIFRSFAVVDETYAVCTISIPFSTGPYPRGNQLDFYHPDVHPKHIPIDYVVLITDEKSLSPAWDVHKTLRAFHRIAGDAVIPYLDEKSGARLASKVSSGIADMPEEEALAVLYNLNKMWEELGYGAPTLIHAASPGDGFVKAAIQQEIAGIGGLGSDAMLMNADQQSSNFSNHIRLVRNCLKAGAASGKNPAGLRWRNHQDTKPPLSPRQYQAAGMDEARLYEDLETGLSEKSDGPRLLPVLLDGDAFDVIEMNRALITRLIEKTREHRLVFARSEEIVRFERG